MTKKYSFQKMYRNFIGSGNINSPYWIIGIETGGKIDIESTEDEFIKNAKSETLLQKHLQNFNDEVEKGVLEKIKQIIYSFDEIDKSVIVKENKDGKQVDVFHFPNSNVFRTNLFMLKLKDTKPLTFSEGVLLYQNYFEEIDPAKIKSRSDLYRDDLIIERAKKLGEEKPKNVKIIICLTLKFYKETKLFLETLFDFQILDNTPNNYIQLNPHNKKDPRSNRYVYKYPTTDKSTVVYFFPQNWNYDPQQIREILNQFE